MAKSIFVGQRKKPPTIRKFLFLPDYRGFPVPADKIELRFSIRKDKCSRVLATLLVDMQVEERGGILLEGREGTAT